ncbi:putative 4-hydroxybenzoate polyprenyltransferase [Hydrogenobacter sp. T-2]|uniref:UbiA-like polyprenyltransferase n=1 Tax=Pampinifervens diazotrophicum TaxID=1632018 RepID=UPI002B25D993|nr:UbiA-like polyprenyltransferase [Hydrogenobacter sp. T-2]WPM31254.1 putative 4-hydroxybenzoate polyprenyltransferase [Hydrogenobacter sp. T-2]
MVNGELKALNMSRTGKYLELVKFEHTIFALPFALASVILLYEQMPSFWRLFWVLLAFISARTVGMALNRLIDLPIDRLNPRTSQWVHARGEVSEESIKRLILFSGGIFIFSTLMINIYAFLLSPIVLFLLWFYPYAKRITYYPHLVLGAVYFLIPLAIDVSFNERISFNAIILGIAMAFWVAGFDILYALQDYEFDKRQGLKSIPVKFGIEGALLIARFFHTITFFALLGLFLRIEFLGILYLLGLFGIGLFLYYEHSLIKPHDLSKINKAFFTVNGYVSVVFLVVVLLDRLI